MPLLSELQVVDAAVALDSQSGWYRVALTAEHAREFLQRVGDSSLIPLIDRIVAANPTAPWWQERFHIGREYSRVIYFSLWKEADGESVLKGLTDIGAEFDASEVASVGRGMIRLWWD